MNPWKVEITVKSGKFEIEVTPLDGENNLRWTISHYFGQGMRFKTKASVLTYLKRRYGKNNVREL